MKKKKKIGSNLNVENRILISEAKIDFFLERKTEIEDMFRSEGEERVSLSQKQRSKIFLA